jgi:hypothetical protein
VTRCILSQPGQQVALWISSGRTAKCSARDTTTTRDLHHLTVSERHSGERLHDGLALHVEFTGTKGGTNLSCEVDRQASDLAGAETVRGTTVSM